MKKTLLFLFLTVFALSFNSCSDDDNGGNNNNKAIDVHVDVTYFSSAQNQTITDVGSIVYLFDGFSIYNGGDWKYQGNGIFLSEKWGTKWASSNKQTVTDTGVSFKNVKGNDQIKSFTIVIESASDKNQTDRYFPVNVFSIESKNANLKYKYGNEITTN